MTRAGPFAEEGGWQAEGLESWGVLMGLGGSPLKDRPSLRRLWREGGPGPARLSLCQHLLASAGPRASSEPLQTAASPSLPGRHCGLTQIKHLTNSGSLFWVSSPLLGLQSWRGRRGRGERLSNMQGSVPFPGDEGTDLL